MGRIVRAAFRFKPFSIKQKKVLTWWLPESPMHDMDGIIADGAIRSGKTITLSLSFVMWAMATFNGADFAMCGKTIGSFRRNVLGVLKLMLWSRGYKYTDHRADNLLEVRRGDVVNSFYIFGGKDERSQDLIQGITLAGVLFDEVALMPESFVTQATGRCSVDGSKFWFSCNPQAPLHYFKVEWIDKAEQKNLLYLHFTMNDNLSLSEKIKARYKAMYSGVFFKRMILGLWVAAEGVIYAQFADDPERYIIKTSDENHFKDLSFISIGIDFGGNRSLTTFVASGFHHGFRKITALKDHGIKGRKGEIDSDRVNREFIVFYKELTEKYPNVPVRYVFADNEAQYLINGLRKACAAAGLPCKVGDSAKKAITQRIYCANTLLNQGKMFITDDCPLLCAGLQQAVWDAKAAEKGKDERLDNFSSDIDILDGWEYGWERFMSKFIPQYLLEKT